MKLRSVVWCALIVLLPAVLLVSCSRKEEGWVAKANGEEISADQFRERYAQYLKATGIRDNIVARKQVLGNMINETLIFQELARLGLDRDPVSLSRLEEIRLQAILDEYTKRITVDTITVSEQELKKEFRAYTTKASARYLYAKTKEEALRLKEALLHGSSFESLARKVFSDPGLANNGGYLGVFGWGEMEPALEQAAFELPVGEVSEPVRLKIGYALVKVETRVRQPLASEYDYAKVKEKLERAVKERKTAEEIRSLTERVVTELQPAFDQRGVAVALHIWPRVSSYVRDIEEAPRLALSPDSSATPLLSYAGGTWTVGEFLSRAVHTSARQQRRVHGEAGIEDVAKGLLARDVLLGRAEKEHLEEVTAVKEQVRKLRDDYLLRRWASNVEDTVDARGWSEDALRARYDRDRAQYVDPPLVNVGEILVRTRGEAETMVHRLRAGAQFASLARTRSIRLWAAKRGGELGFGSKADFGVMGEKFFAARTGDILGPAFVDPYWGVFKILGRKEGRQIEFAEARERIVESLNSEERQRALVRAVDKLRGAGKVDTQMHTLEFIELSNESQH